MAGKTWNELGWLAQDVLTGEDLLVPYAPVRAKRTDDYYV